MDKTFTIANYEQYFRIKPMNAIETLAIRTQISLKDMRSAMKFYTTILEHIEVEIGGKWLPVKTEGREIYYPDGIENDVRAVDELMQYFTKEYLEPVFTKSRESKD